MNQNSSLALGQISQFGIAGAFGGMVLIGTILWWDVSGIGSMLTATEELLRLNLFLAGAMLKGALLGAVLGAAMPMKQRMSVKVTAGTPIGYTAQV